MPTNLQQAIHTIRRLTPPSCLPIFSHPHTPSPLLHIHIHSYIHTHTPTNTLINQVATKYSDQLGADALIKLFEKFKSFEVRVVFFFPFWQAWPALCGCDCVFFLAGMAGFIHVCVSVWVCGTVGWHNTTQRNTHAGTCVTRTYTHCPPHALLRAYSNTHIHRACTTTSRPS